MATQLQSLLAIMGSLAYTLYLSYARNCIHGEHNLDNIRIRFQKDNQYILDYPGQLVLVYRNNNNQYSLNKIKKRHTMGEVFYFFIKY